MNLRLFHAVLILLSAALAVMFGLWSLGVYGRPNGVASVPSAVAAFAVALFVASVKGALVACYFMHLISEKKLIYAVLVITVIKFVALMVLPALTHGNGFWIEE